MFVYSSYDNIQVKYDEIFQKNNQNGPIAFMYYNIW